MKKLILNKYDNVIKYSVFANNINPYLNNGNLKDDSFHNYFRLKTFPKSKFTYCGEFKCGVTCFILGNLLKQDGFDVKMYLYEEGYGKYKEDHVFLKYNNLIIDPTYRQFFTNNINNGISNYNNYIYNILPPFFIGTQNELKSIYFYLIKNFPYETNFIFSNKHELFKYWIEKKDITFKLHDYFNIIENKEYLINKIGIK